MKEHIKITEDSQVVCTSCGRCGVTERKIWGHGSNSGRHLLVFRASSPPRRRQDCAATTTENPKLVATVPIWTPRSAYLSPGNLVSAQICRSQRSSPVLGENGNHQTPTVRNHRFFFLKKKHSSRHTRLANIQGLGQDNLTLERDPETRQNTINSHVSISRRWAECWLAAGGLAMFACWREWGWAALMESIAAGSCLGIGGVEAAGDNCGALTRGRCGREGTHGACLGRDRESCWWLGCTWCCQWNCVAPTSRQKSAC